MDVGGGDFITAAEVVRRIKEDADNVDAIEINMNYGSLLPYRTRTGVEFASGVGAVVRYCDGKMSLITIEAAEELLNSDFIRGMRMIQIRLAHPLVV